MERAKIPASSHGALNKLHKINATATVKTMDTRNKNRQRRADGRGTFSPRSYATPACLSSQTAKPHAACAFAILVLAVPLAALADDTGSTTTVVLDVAKNGSLGALITAAIFWLNSERKRRTADAQSLTPPPPPERNPPLGEDVARNYCLKSDLIDCRAICRKDIDGLRELIEEKDRSNEERIIGTHKRIDQVYKSLNKNNRSLGIIIGALFAQGKIPASVLTETEGD